MKKTFITFAQSFLLLVLTFTTFGLKAQDTLIKTNGQVISCTILEVGTNGVSYKKTGLSDGPTFTENKSDIELIKYQNGKLQTFAEAEGIATINSNTVTPNSQTNQIGSAPNYNQNVNGKPQKGPISPDSKIIFDGKRYYVDGQKIGRRDVDRLLSRSTNPAVAAPYKVAKLTKTFQKIVSITSWPSTITGGIASIGTFATVIKESKHHISTSSWVNAGLSFVGTLTFPITSKILKKQRDKLYDKAIDIYNVGKK
jgi:hypothetical protein